VFERSAGPCFSLKRHAGCRRQRSPIAAQCPLPSFVLVPSRSSPFDAVWLCLFLAAASQALVGVVGGTPRSVVANEDGLAKTYSLPRLLAALDAPPLAR
jgi:hypothetical protein